MWIGQSKRWRGGKRMGNAAMPSYPERKRFANAGLLGGLSELFADESAARSPTARSPRSFGGGGSGAVGLGIVAAMSGPVARGSPAGSEPIPIGSARGAAEPREEEEELSESYTRVIWHVGGSLAGERVYFEEASVF